MLSHPRRLSLLSFQYLVPGMTQLSHRKMTRSAQGARIRRCLAPTSGTVPLLPSARGRQRRYCSPARRVFDERGQPLAPGLFPLGADDPPDSGLPVPGRLGLEEAPGSLVGAELPLERGAKFGRVPLLVRVHSSPFALLEHFEPRSAHQPQTCEFPHAFDVHGTPYAARLPRRKPDRIAPAVDAPANAIDPAVTQRRVDRFRPRQARFTRAPLVESNPEFGGFLVMLLKPSTEFRGIRKETRGHA